jgi:coenzyme PQQ precursor peptide PqqA
MLFAVRGAGGKPSIDTHVDMVSPRTTTETAMIWETPVAIDFRFGMEITMYVSNR